MKLTLMKLKGIRQFSPRNKKKVCALQYQRGKKMRKQYTTEENKILLQCSKVELKQQQPLHTQME